MAMWSNKSFLCPFLLIISILFLTSLSSSRVTAYKFHVGGRDGWVIKPSEDYSHWAQRNRFQVNDTFYFRYQKEYDSVVVVNQKDYYSCNANNPIDTMTDGDSRFIFDKSGPFFFISGNVENCRRGQKLIVVVLAVRHKHSQSPPPASPPSAAASPTEAEAPAESETSPSPSVSPSSTNYPAPSPMKHSGSTRFSGSVVVTFGVSFAVVLFFSMFTC